MYDLTIEEGLIILKRFEEDNKLSWLQTKYICYNIIQSQSTKLINFKDFMIFPWDEKKENENEIKPINKKELYSKVIEMEKKLNK